MMRGYEYMLLEQMLADIDIDDLVKKMFEDAKGCRVNGKRQCFTHDEGGEVKEEVERNVKMHMKVLRAEISEAADEWTDMQAIRAGFHKSGKMNEKMKDMMKQMLNSIETKIDEETGTKH